MDASIDASRIQVFSASSLKILKLRTHPEGTSIGNKCILWFQFVPQECTRDTKGLLYFDLLSSKMHRCNGLRWEPWGWGAGDGYQYTALLKDAAGSEQDEEDDSAPPPPLPPPLPALPLPTSNPPGRPTPSPYESSPRLKIQKKTCRSGNHSTVTLLFHVCIFRSICISCIYVHVCMTVCLYVCLYVCMYA